MDKLPAELLHKIFIQLDLQQRLACLTVCRSWWRVLDKYRLFYSIVLQKSDDHLNRFMDMFKRLPKRAAQVEELTITLHTDTRFNRRELLQLFPNARKMEVDHCSGEWRLLHHYTQDIDLTHSNSKVEFLCDFYHCELVSQIVYSRLGSQLKTLYLKDMSLQDTSSILSQLKDLPVLKTLTFESAFLAIDDLELLHKNVPSIQELTLDLLALYGSMPSEVVPTSSITKLKFDGGYPIKCEVLCEVYQYITKKYASVAEIDFHDLELDRYKPSDIKYLYLNGYLDLLKLIGPTRHELTLRRVPENVDPFEVLDAVDSKLKQIRLYRCESEAILQDLFRSNQSKCVQVLILTDTNIESIHLIKDMASLTQLSIDFTAEDAPPLHLSNCLASCPDNVKTLSLRCPDLVAKPSIMTLDSIERLNIDFTILTSELGDIISQSFPNLVKLELYFKYLENTNIILKSPQLQHATFYKDKCRSIRDDKYGLSFKSADQTETQYYLYDELAWKGVQFEDIQHLPTLSFRSFAKQKLDLENGINILPC